MCFKVYFQRMEILSFIVATEKVMRRGVHRYFVNASRDVSADVPVASPRALGRGAQCRHHQLAVLAAFAL